MTAQALREKIAQLDPQVCGALRAALMAQSKRIGEGDMGSPPGQERFDVTDAFAEMYRKAADEINRRYIEGTDLYIRQRQPQLHREMLEAEERLNDVWIAGRRGKADIAEFREVLKRWYSLHLRASRVFAIVAKGHGPQAERQAQQKETV